MNIDQRLHSLSPREAIALLRGQEGTDQRALDKARDAIELQRHKVNNRSLRPDKYVAIDLEDDSDLLQYQGQRYSLRESDGQRQIVRVDLVNRVALALQRRIVGTAVAFTFGNPVAYGISPHDEAEEAVASAFQSIVSSTKLPSHDRKLARLLFTYGEVAELWTPVETQATEHYGLKTPFKLRVHRLSYENGDRLYPYYDEYGDMVAFSRAYSIRQEGKDIERLDAYTADWLYRYEGEQLVEGYPRPNALGKIPVVYARQSGHDTEDVDSLIERLETLLSNFSDTNDYHASPKIFVTGEMRGFSRKGEAGAIIEGEKDATAQYLSWSSAPEAVRLEIDTLLRLIYSISQTPDISFESVKGLGSISGAALKLLFMDAHLKVQDKREVLDEYLDRRCSIIKSYIGVFDHSLREASKRLEVTPEITPYSITIDKDDLDYWLAASGNKPLISHEEAVQRAGLSTNPNATIEAIRAEEERASLAFATEPTQF